ncbi:NmrA family NAD(P)-binding protein [Catenulispora acidiphila]
MPVYVVTAATGQLGQLVVRHLLHRVDADQIAVVVRNASRATHPAEHGIEVRVADYDDPASLAGAFGAGDRVLLISGNQFGARLTQHANVIAAAKSSGIAQLAYTSILGGPSANFPVADDHHVTEQALLESGLPFTLLRNGWYTENYTSQLTAALHHGAVVGAAAPASRLATAARADYAEAAAVVLVGAGHENNVYELSGDTAWSLEEYAAEISRQTASTVPYRQLPPADYEDFLAGLGLPTPMLSVFTATEAAIDRGELADTGGDLRRLIGRPTTTLAESIAAELAELTSR